MNALDKLTTWLMIMAVQVLLLVVIVKLNEIIVILG